MWHVRRDRHGFPHRADRTRSTWAQTPRGPESLTMEGSNEDDRKPRTEMWLAAVRCTSIVHRRATVNNRTYRALFYYFLIFCFSGARRCFSFAWVITSVQLLVRKLMDFIAFKGNLRVADLSLWGTVLVFFHEIIGITAIKLSLYRYVITNTSDRVQWILCWNNCDRILGWALYYGSLNEIYVFTEIRLISTRESFLRTFSFCLNISYKHFVYFACSYILFNVWISSFFDFSWKFILVSL